MGWEKHISVMLFRPDQSNIGRLVNRKKSDNNTANILVESDTAKIGMSFSSRKKKWDAEIKMEEKWIKQIKQMSDLTSVFIPAKEIGPAYGAERRLYPGTVG